MNNLALQANNKVFQHSLHRELWQWLGDNPLMDKEDWGRWVDNGGNVPMCDSDCFACSYNYDRFDAITNECDCSLCPLQWSGKDCTASEFRRWERSRSDEERTRLAYAIRDLPVKDGVIYE